MSDITSQTLTELVKNIKEKKISSEETAKAYIERAEKSKILNSYITENFSSALEKANTGIYNLRQTYNYIYEINMTLLCLNIRILSIIDDLSKRNLSYISFNI